MIWYWIALLDQLTLYNALNGREDLGTEELRAVATTLTNEKQNNSICFLMHETEEFAGLPDGQGIQAVANVCYLLDYLLTIEPNAGGIFVAGSLTNLWAG